MSENVVNSELRVNASEELDIQMLNELNKEDPDKSLDELLKEANENSKGNDRS